MSKPKFKYKKYDLEQNILEYIKENQLSYCFEIKSMFGLGNNELKNITENLEKQGKISQGTSCGATFEDKIWFCPQQEELNQDEK